MKNNDAPKPLEKQIAETAKSLNLDFDVLRAISAKELRYLIDHCPFLQITDTAIRGIDQSPVKIVTAHSGWDIHDHGDALSSSPGRFLLGGGDFRVVLDDDDGGDEGGSVLNAGKGTVYKQAFDTAIQMVEIAFEHRWGGINIADGHPLMKRAAWMQAEKLGLAVEGFEPSEEDLAIRDRIELTENDLELLRHEGRNIKKSPAEPGF